MNYGKATKKPITIHFYKWDGDINSLEDWIKSLVSSHVEDLFEVSESGLKVKTLEGTSYDVPHDYIIIKGVKDEFYPCDPIIFNETYDVLTLHTENKV